MKHTIKAANARLARHQAYSTIRITKGFYSLYARSGAVKVGE